MNFKTYQDLATCISNNIHKIPYDTQLIVGIPRSGVLAGSMLALYMNLPFISLDDYVDGRNFTTGTTRKSRNWIKSTSEARNVLVIDDSISSGKAIKEAKEKINTMNPKPSNVSYCAVYALPITCHLVDIYFELCNQPRMFEWNYLHHWALEFCCMDIDGVLCEDPNIFQNDDGLKYIDFIKNATPRFLPTQKVGKLVTTRLSRYRCETETWLKQHGVEFGELVMMENITAKERALRNNHAEFKARVYKSCDSILFFESNYSQALDICRLSGKPVFCTETRTLINSNNVLEKIDVYNK
ncbi:MAG: phosphoribosyltransferase, partial [Butyrivibrio sp.]|nr:phosphoribosyltransferase [Butyrivibrio sp.]